MKEGKLVVVTDDKMPDGLMNPVLDLVSEGWREVSISKIPSSRWNNIDFSEKNMFY